MEKQKVNFYNFFKRFDTKNISFNGETISFLNSENQIVININASFSFVDCTLILNNISDLLSILRERSNNIKLSLNNCKIFIKTFNFNDAFMLKKLGSFASFFNNNLIIYNGLYKYTLDNFEEFDLFITSLKARNCKVLISLKTVFPYAPVDFERFSNLIKYFNLQSVHFDFLYTSDSQTIPNLAPYSNVLGELRIQNAILTKRNIPYCLHVTLIDCKGGCCILSRNIKLIRCKKFDISFLPGTRIDIEEGSYGSVYCKGKFSIYFDNPAQYSDNSIVIEEGSVRNTNKKSILKERSKIYKYKMFINTDFSMDDKITKFYNCRFVNCYFNSNQYLLNCQFQKCFFSEGSEFVIEC